MESVSVQDLKARLSSVVAAAESGQTIVITRHGKPVARLGPAEPPHVQRGRLVGERWPRAVTTGLGRQAIATLLDDRGDR